MVQSPLKAHLRVMLIIFFLAFVLVGSILATPAIYAAHAASVVGSPADPNIKYIGRWDTSSSTVANSYWGGAYFKTAFTGTTVKIKLGKSASIYASIDGKTDVLYKAVTGTVNLTPTHLSAGTHTLRVAARFQTDFLQFQGLVLDAGASTVAPTLSTKLIEFVGDSITAGVKDSKQALSDYAWLVGEQLHTEHTQIAQGGICLIDNIHCYALGSIGMSRQFFKLQTVDYPTSPDWDFSRYQADAVVINLGTNDNTKALSDITFQSVYITFIKNIRTKYPHAHIFVLRTFGGYKATPTLAAVRAINAAGDSNVHYVDTTGWLVSSDFASDGLHPTDSGQQKVTNDLAPIIQPYLTGTPPPNGYYEIVNRNSGQVLDITADSTANGALAIQWPYHAGTNQQWQKVSINGGYKLVNRHSSKLLDDPGGSKTNGTQLDQQSDSNGSNQQWNLVSAGNGNYYLVNQGSGLYAEVAGGSTTNGASVVLWPSTGGTEQQWQLIAV